MFTTQGTLSQALKLREVLDPTPAVGGYPTDTAIELINYFETHERLCYAGTINIRDTSDMGFKTFVNLRSMLIAPGNDGDYRSSLHYNIYVGGGITASSNPESEWIETAEKASLMLEALADKNQATDTSVATLYDQINIEACDPSYSQSVLSKQCKADTKWKWSQTKSHRMATTNQIRQEKSL